MVTRQSGLHAIPQEGRVPVTREVRLGLREVIPAEGLREYWYPALEASHVGHRHPVALDFLGHTVVFFRDGKDEVVAVDDACPHRGMALSRGTCHFRGFLTCPYHGWTFDGEGNCTAVLSEGPDSHMPGQTTTAATTYPTKTLKNMVFVWMGEGAPAPIEEDVPPEFFDPHSQIFFSRVDWTCNWRPAIENYLDSHVFYVHRNSARLLGFTYQRLNATIHRFDGGNKPAIRVVNERALAADRVQFQSLRGMLADSTEDSGGIAPANAVANDSSIDRRSFQYSFPALDGARWPKTRGRIYLSKFIAALRPGQRKPKRVLETNPEWSMLHLPSTIRTDNSNYIFSRIAVPIDAEHTRVIYYHTRFPRRPWQRLRYAIMFKAIYNWSYNYNFSGQDKEIVERQHYDTREKFSTSDAVPLEWRKLVAHYARTTSGRGLGRYAEDDSE